MPWFVFALLLLPALAVGWIWFSRRPTKVAWPEYLKRVGILFCIGWIAASPFITTRGLGTGEAYNYSLATADAVKQFREGVFPVLVGQSEYAFNGRVHPIRTAPFMAYFAGLLDLVTFRQLNFWALQNLTLALSLIGAAFSAYASLRRATSIAPGLALVLASGFVLAPGVLAPAYSMDLYMTVTTLPFVPLALGAALRTLRGDRRFLVYALLGAAIAATWLAHPPVALWLTAGIVILQLPLFVLWRWRGRELLNAAAGALLCLALCGYSFASALTIQDYTSATKARDTVTTIGEVSRVFKDSLRPVSAKADALSDFQLGYAYWALLAIATLGAIARRRFDALLLCAIAGFYLIFTTPVPGLNAWLWTHVPSMVATMTSYWPMQRLYLLITAFAIFGFAAGGLSFSLDWARPKIFRDALGLALIAGGVWTAYEAWHFVGRGLGTRIDAERSAIVHRPENIDLTVTSYAFIGAPPYFVNGVMDPKMELRLLQPGTMDVAASNWNAPGSLGQPVQEGAFRTAQADGDFVELKPRFTLKPNTRYRLDFNFQSAPLDASLQIVGPHTFREYKLPKAGASQGFGMLPENNHALTLWTTANEDEEVTLKLVAPGLGATGVASFANFSLRPIDEAKLPVRVDSWVPFRVRVHADAPAYLETPRIFVKGYTPIVNGKPVRAQESPARLLMFPVPAGDSVVEINYTGPGLARVAFWTAAIAWLGFFGFGGYFVFVQREPEDIPRSADTDTPSRRPIGPILLRVAAAVIVIAVLVGGVTFFRNRSAREHAYAEAAGPLHIRLILPRKETGRSQPLVTTGKKGEGTFIFIQYTDPTHIKIGVDVWGLPLYVSEPIAVDYYAEQDFVVSSGALYPPGHPKLKSIDPARLEALRKHITVTLNGTKVVDREVFSYESEIKDVTVGESRIGVSNTEPKFVGQILEVERLPIPEKP
ncbi:MAG TPA: hypothetical protein VFT72_20105 [Opitutaceae bacterium]|nr:hypothetical protein [Opitutaceae bacterium]